MGGVFRKTAPAVAEAAKQVTAPQPAASKPAEQMAAEDRSARRRARRGGRALLSESRLNPEEGVSTLGQSGMM
jgi:hypothetical protein